MRVVYSYPASLRRRWTRFTSSRARPSWIRSSVSRGSTAATYGPSACTAQSLTTSRVTSTSSGRNSKSPDRTGSPRSSACSSAAVSCDTDRKSTRLNSSHLVISYAVFCLKKKKKREYYKAVVRSYDSCCVDEQLERKCPPDSRHPAARPALHPPRSLNPRTPRVRVDDRSA